MQNYDNIGRKNTNTTAIFKDSQGAIYVAGNTEENLGGTNPQNRSTPYVLKYPSISSCREWVQTFVSTLGNGQITSAAIDSNANIYILGTSASATIGAETCNSGVCNFITKLDKDGNILWSKLLTSISNIPSQKLTLDSSANIYLVGSTSSAVNGQNPSGTTDAFIIKLDTDGNLSSSFLLGVSGKYTRGEVISVDPNGNIYFMGNTNGSLGGQTPGGNGTTVYLAKYNSTLSQEWIRYVGVGVNPGSYRSTGITFDPSGNIYFGVNFNGTGYVEGNQYLGINNSLIYKFNSAGTKQWYHVVGFSGGSTEAITLTYSSFNRIMVFGTAFGTVNNISTDGYFITFRAFYEQNGTYVGLDLFGPPNTNRYATSVYYSGTDVYYSYTGSNTPAPGTQGGFMTSL
ncbi:SBBP repeat-containing protein [Leptospira koniambonensis]|uniref:SBBP repeat-containing protein n=1 Tax=Leptospira koniambonensis TaxID=2484950 RepID=UPI003EBF4B48